MSEEIALPEIEDDSSGELLEAYQKKIQHANALLDDIYEKIRSLQ
ncbi:hypothetical protein [Massiliimalia massiliensis]|jgi:hypothetical protein|nr:hypothetical protein [Massiliimalia massiliensis]